MTWNKSVGQFWELIPSFMVLDLRNPFHHDNSHLTVVWWQNSPAGPLSFLLGQLWYDWAQSLINCPASTCYHCRSPPSLLMRQENNWLNLNLQPISIKCHWICSLKSLDWTRGLHHNSAKLLLDLWFNLHSFNRNFLRSPCALFTIFQVSLVHSTASGK